MALAQNRFVAALWGRLRTKVGVHLTRFAGVAIAALATSEIALSICNGVFHMTPGPAALISTFAGAVVSYVLSRWAWERKGKPDVLRETVPFWVISAMVWVILYLATKFGYKLASAMGLHGFKHVLLVDLVYLLANFVTFLLRFVIFHYVLFADRTTAARAAATGPDTIPPGTRQAPNPAEAPHSAAPAATAEGPHASARAAGAAATGTSPNGATSATPGSANGATSANGAKPKPSARRSPASSPTTAD